MEKTSGLTLGKGMPFSSAVSALLVIFIMITSGSASAQVKEEWVARYNGPGNGPDTANALTVDAAGNVYVTGHSFGLDTYGDYTTIKYDANGNELWVARYNGPGNGPDTANALTVDAAGNVYVAGFSTGSDTGWDYATIKYDANGNELWVTRYNGPGNSYDRAIALAVDAGGNVYVTGFSTGLDRHWDYATIKYDANGNELWVARYDAANNESATATDLAVDAGGNVYVTGYIGPVSSWNIYLNSDCATIKYDANGNELWVARYNGPGNRNDTAHALTVDAGGNVYVTGESTGSDTDGDYATIKYDANGNELWVARYNGPGNGPDTANALTVDAAGNVYVTGFSTGSDTDGDYATIKYDANGNELWVTRYNGLGNRDDTAHALAVDAGGNVYVTGESTGSDTGWDYATIKYDVNGNELWVTRYNGPGNGYDLAHALAVDATGNVYVTGESFGDWTTIKLVPNSSDSGGGDGDGNGGGGGGGCFISTIAP